jgi:hypothetical protein
VVGESQNQEAAGSFRDVVASEGDVRGVQRKVCVRGDAGGVLVQRGEAERDGKGGIEDEVQKLPVQEVPGEVCGKGVTRFAIEDQSC